MIASYSALFLSARRNTLWCVQNSLRRVPAREALAVSCSTVNDSNAAPAAAPPPALPAKEFAPRSLRRGEDEVITAITSLRRGLFSAIYFFSSLKTLIVHHHAKRCSDTWEDAPHEFSGFTVLHLPVQLPRGGRTTGHSAS